MMHSTGMPDNNHSEAVSSDNAAFSTCTNTKHVLCKPDKCPDLGEILLGEHKMKSCMKTAPSDFRIRMKVGSIEVIEQVPPPRSTMHAACNCKQNSSSEKRGIKPPKQNLCCVGQISFSYRSPFPNTFWISEDRDVVNLSHL